MSSTGHTDEPHMSWDSSDYAVVGSIERFFRYLGTGREFLGP